MRIKLKRDHELGASLTQPLAPEVKKKIFLYLGIETV